MKLSKLTASFFLMYNLILNTGTSHATILVFTEVDPLKADQPIGTIRRAAFDFGGGSIRVTVGDIDPNTNKLVQKLFTAQQPIKFRLHLSQNKNTFSQDIVQIALESLKELKDHTLKYNPQDYAACATEAFRMAQNGQELLEKLTNETSIPIHVIPQEEEGRLGFISVVQFSNSNPKNTIVLDVGTGSVQITAQNQDGSLETFGLKLGSVAIYDKIAKIRNLETTPTDINPVSKEEAIAVMEYLQTAFDLIPAKLQEKLTSKEIQLVASCKVINQPGSILTYDAGWKFLEAILDHPSGGLVTPSSAGAGLVCYTLLRKFQIEECLLSGSNAEGNNLGILTSPKYWNKIN